MSLKSVNNTKHASNWKLFWFTKLTFTPITVDFTSLHECGHKDLFTVLAGQESLRFQSSWRVWLVTESNWLLSGTWSHLWFLGPLCLLLAPKWLCVSFVWFGQMLHHIWFAFLVNSDRTYNLTEYQHIHLVTKNLQTWWTLTCVCNILIS